MSHLIVQFFTFLQWGFLARSPMLTPVLPMWLEVLCIFVGTPMWLFLKVCCTLLVRVTSGSFFMPSIVFKHEQKWPTYISKLHGSPMGCFKVLNDIGLPWLQTTA